MKNKPESPQLKKRRRRLFTRVRRFLRSVPEVMLVETAQIIIPRISRKSELRLSRCLGRTFCFLAIRSRRIAMANLDIVYGDSKTREEKQRILRASFKNAAQILLDYFWFSRNPEERVVQYCHMGDEVTEQWVSGDFPGILVTAHLGNWELGGQLIAIRGRPILSVYRPIGARKTQNALLKFRKASGMKLLPREGAVLGMLRALRANSLVGVILDQHTDLKDGGIYFDFFGVPATFSNAVGTVAHRMNVPICVFGLKYDGDADDYTLKSYKVISAAEAASMAPEEITGQIVSVMTQMILDNPEQWFWMYRRWKRYRPDDDRSKFPFYSKIEDNA